MFSGVRERMHWERMGCGNNIESRWRGIYRDELKTMIQNKSSLTGVKIINILKYCNLLTYHFQ